VLPGLNLKLLILAKTRFNIEALVVDEQHRGKMDWKKIDGLRGRSCKHI